MNKGARLTLLFVVSGLFFIADRLLKNLALNNPTRLLNRFFGWQPYFNPGIGFGLPVPNVITLLLTGAILLLLAYLIYLKIKKTTAGGADWQLFSLALIFTGAFSNFIDRLLYQYTIDYLFILTGYINLADILIVGGMLIFLFASKRTS